MADPIFLMCSERAGSNLITTILDAHPRVCGPRPTHLGNLFWRNIHRYGDLQRDESWRRVVADTINWLKAYGRVATELTEEELLKNVKTREFKAIYDYVYEHERAKTKKDLLFIKENHVHRQLFFLAHAYPAAKYVFQVRDPRDVVASRRGNMALDNSLKGAVRIWEEDQTAFLSALYALSSRVFMLRYEDLLTDTQLVLEHLCAFLELPFSPAMLNFHETERAEVAAKLSPNWRNLNKPILKDRAGRYRETLTRSELMYVEHKLARLMLRFGYSPETDHDGVRARLIASAYEHLPDAERVFAKREERAPGDAAQAQARQSSESRWAAQMNALLDEDHVHDSAPPVMPRYRSDARSTP